MKTLDIKTMTQKEFDDLIAEIKANSPKHFQLISDLVDGKITAKEVELALK